MHFFATHYWGLGHPMFGGAFSPVLLAIVLVLLAALGFAGHALRGRG